jgi:hypothetical protein
MPGRISAPPVPRVPPNYGQTRNPEERGMSQYPFWDYDEVYRHRFFVTDTPMYQDVDTQYLRRIEATDLSALTTADKAALIVAGLLVITAFTGREHFRK